MDLKTVHITEFRSILDTTPFDVGGITCLVGKNESGKTAVLQALYRLNPITEEDATFSITDDYPRREVEDYRLAVESGEREHADVVRATYVIGDDDLAAVTDVFGSGAVRGRQLVLSRGYDQSLEFEIDVDEEAAIRYTLSQVSLLPDTVSRLRSTADLGSCREILGKEEQTENIKELVALFDAVANEGGLSEYIYSQFLEPRVPKFLYFDEYHLMRGQENIEALLERKTQGNLRPSDHPMLGMIELARLSIAELAQPTSTESLVNRLEGAGNHLSGQVLKFWSQNKHLKMRFDMRPALAEDPEDMRSGNNIWARVYDSRHDVSTPLGTRSRGFVWFFSFLAWFHTVRASREPVVLLLDEPGLSLHGRAQADLLRFFEQELCGRGYQVIYSTHSPFMVNAHDFSQVRIVQDRGIDTFDELPRDQEGTKVGTDVLEASSDSLFPLQGALGYDIYQTLFVGPNSLVVEGVSDLLYIQTLSGLLQSNGRAGLNSAWTITPVGGSEKVATFVALIGAQKNLKVATLIDIQKKDRQSIESLYKRKLLKKKNVLTFGDFTSSEEADIEDMFDADLYLRLINEEFGADLADPVQLDDLDSNLPRVLTRLEKYFEDRPMNNGAEFSHYRPARRIAENAGTLSKEISAGTLDRFQAAFDALNALL